MTARLRAQHTRVGKPAVGANDGDQVADNRNNATESQEIDGEHGSDCNSKGQRRKSQRSAQGDRHQQPGSCARIVKRIRNRADTAAEQPA